MKLGQFIQFMFASKLWPVKVNPDGSLRSNLFNVVTLFIFTVFVAALCVVSYFVGPSILARDYGKLSSFIDLFMVGTIILQPFFLVVFLALSFPHFESTICDSSLRFSWKFVAWLGAGIILFAALTVLTQRKLFLFSYSHWIEYLVFWMFLAFVDILSLMYQVSFMAFLTFCCLLLQEKIEDTCAKSTLTNDDLKDVINFTKNVNSALDIFSPMLFFMLQISLIFGIYLIVVSKEAFPYYAVCFIALNIMIIYNFLNNIEECYSLAGQLACKAREQAALSTSISEMVRIQAAVIELELCFPFSAMGYFTIEKSTLTSLAANTLTYIIVLVQFDWK